MNDQPITIRSLGPEDAELLDRALPGFERMPDAARAWPLLNTRVNEMVVALTDGRVVGYGAGTVVMQPARATTFFVSALEVHRDYRRRGAGRRMLSALIEAGFERGCEEVWLCLSTDKPEGHALCEGLGGAISDRHAIFSWDGVA